MAGFRGVPELTGTWLHKRTTVVPGFRGVLHLVGVWVTGAAPVVPPIKPVFDTDGVSKWERRDLRDLEDLATLLGKV